MIKEKEKILSQAVTSQHHRELLSQIHVFRIHKIISIALSNLHFLARIVQYFIHTNGHGFVSSGHRTRLEPGQPVAVLG